jgi:hypothetical protein
MRINAEGELSAEQLEVMTDFFFYVFAYVGRVCIHAVMYDTYANRALYTA